MKVCEVCSAPILNRQKFKICYKCLMKEAKSSDTTNEPKKNKSPTKKNIFRKYQILSLISEGGMGKVYKAKDLSFNRIIALKVCKNHSAETLKRFAKEAKITSQLNHPNIITIHEVELHKSLVFYTMQYVEGETLGQILNKIELRNKEYLEKFPLRKLLKIFYNVCKGIEYAHQRQVIHRDIKPDNIMVDKFGEVHIMDWGLVKISPTDHFYKQKNAILQDDLTLDGRIVGSPHYMSPELANGEINEADTRSDLFSLGAVLYSILTLQKPFAGDTIHQIIQNTKTLTLDPPHLKFNKTKSVENTEKHPWNIDKAISKIAMKALEKNPEDRYQHISEFMLDLRKHQRGYAPIVYQPFSYRLKLLFKRKKKLSIATISMLSILILYIFSQIDIHSKNKLINQVIKDEKRNWNLILEESFTNPENLRDKFFNFGIENTKHEDGTLFFNDIGQNAIIPQEIYYGDLAIEFEFQIYGENRGIAIILSDYTDIKQNEGLYAYTLVHGYNNKYDSYLKFNLEKSLNLTIDYLSYQQYKPVLKEGVMNHFRAEIIGFERKLFINHKLIFETRDDRGHTFPRIGLATFNTKAKIDNFKIFRLGLPLKNDLLKLAEHYLIKQEFVLSKKLLKEMIQSEQSSKRKGKSEQLLKTIDASEKNIESLKQHTHLFSFNINNNLTFSIRISDPNFSSLNTLKLHGPIQSLDISKTKVSDLQKISGLALQHLDISHSKVTNLKPLMKMPLKKLFLGKTPIREFDILKQFKLDELNLENTNIDRINQINLSQLRKLNIAYTLITEMPEIQYKLKYLDISGLPLLSYKFINNMKLHTLISKNTNFNHIQYLNREDLRTLDIRNSNFVQLDKLEGFNLDILHCGGKKVKALPSLQNLGLSFLHIESENLKGINFLKNFKGLLYLSSIDVINQSSDSLYKTVILDNITSQSFKNIFNPNKERIIIKNSKNLNYEIIKDSNIKQLILFDESIRNLSFLNKNIEFLNISECKNINDISYLIECKKLKTVLFPMKILNYGILKKHPSIQYIGVNHIPIKKSDFFQMLEKISH